MMKQFEEDFQIFDTKAQNPPVGVPSTYNDRTRMVYQAALRTPRLFLKNGYKKACIGLSGGIDSAVVACLAADALGAGNVQAPCCCLRSSRRTIRSKTPEAGREPRHRIQRNSHYRNIYQCGEHLKPVIGGREFDATENIQTRIRTVLLMAVQNKTDYILLNSSNKSECAGLCTLYGDTAVRSAPRRPYKSEMYDVALSTARSAM